jgi:adenine-specific DNA-methyltransferase
MNKINTRKALNPAYRKHKPLRKDVTNFIVQLQDCINAVKLSDDNGESEEHIKSHFTTFFNTTFYANNYINTKDRIDLAIYVEDKPTSDVGVIIEAKKPSNKAEFLREDNLNRKALQELLLYYLRERLDNNNNNIKHLIATNGYEWYLFKSEDFYNYFFKNKALIKEYKDFRDGLKDTTKNELFYNEIAKKYIAEVEQELPYVHLDFTSINLSKLKDGHLNTLYKIFSDVHILGHPFGNDSNQLNKTFYNELLHIIGLEEVKDKGKKIINRKTEKDRDYASLLENTIFHLEDRDYLSSIKSIPNGADKPFNAGLELCLTWVNRILFLKLLESQLLTYHQKDEKYKFLNANFINGFDDLNDLFFSALAKQEDQRHPKYKDKYKDIPYLNSSLFERNTLEEEAFEISALNNDEIAIYSGTVLKDANGKKQKGKLTTLEYLFKFLDAYNFATDGTEGIEDEQETKSLINASVLGLIFEKINGYKEGSFYTPAYITMYMCRETIRRTVVQKFKEQEEDQIETFEDLQSYCSRLFKVDDLKRLNNIVNSIKICDPAVGSGHFLVSALNELIVIKNELKILVDAKGMPLRCDIEIVNDELYVIDDKGALFEYNPIDKESVRVQHTLFHEKQTLIENCLFGVDINPNSVKICRLRLWIELLKNAYYTPLKRLQTLPNIDINIKCGNSLISRFKLDDDLKGAFKNKDLNYTFTDYKNAVTEYKETNNKDRKKEVLQIIDEVKNNFKSTLDNAFLTKYQKAQGELINEQERQNNLKNFGEKIKKSEKDALKKLKTKAEKTYLEKEEIVNNAIYENSFEWRFEFPEVLNDEGTYVGFDVIIGNPPYIRVQELPYKAIDYYKNNFKIAYKRIDISVLFSELGYNLLSKNGYLSYITSNQFLKAEYGREARKFLKDKLYSNIDYSKAPVFEGLATYVSIIGIVKKIFSHMGYKLIDFPTQVPIDLIQFDNSTLNEEPWNFNVNQHLTNKIYSDFLTLDDIANFTYGVITGFDGAFLIPIENTKRLNLEPEVIKKFIRPQNYKKYLHLNQTYYLIYPYKEDNEIFDEHELKDDYPNTYNFLLSHKEKLENRKDSRVTIKEKGVPWYSIMRRVNLEDINTAKIVFYDVGMEPNFMLDENHHIFGGGTSHSLSLKSENYNLKYVLGILNSSLMKWVIYDICPVKMGNARKYGLSYIKKLPIPLGTSLIQKSVSSIVEKITDLKKKEADTTSLEKEIDQMVYKLYGLTEEEIAIVENS